LHAYKLDEAKERLEDLIQEAADGTDVVIEAKDGSNFRLVRLDPPRQRGGFGILKGKIRMGEDFDEPVPEFEPYTA